MCPRPMNLSQHMFPLSESTCVFDRVVGALLAQMAVPGDATPTSSSMESSAFRFSCDTKRSSLSMLRTWWFEDLVVLVSSWWSASPESSWPARVPTLSHSNPSRVRRCRWRRPKGRSLLCPSPQLVHGGDCVDEMSAGQQQDS
jgi:hypothetical protein